MAKILSTLLVVSVVAAISLLVWGGDRGISINFKQKTVDDRKAEILAKKPGLKQLAWSAQGKLKIFVFKHERRVELHAPGWKAPRVYSMTAFSGRLGPKLREGDHQIPEGLYDIEYLNPNSRFYLSLKVSYPNEDDRVQAAKDGREHPGTNIMIHGKAATVGCVPVGDDAIEDIFYLVAEIGRKNVSIVMAPYDMRKGRNPELEVSDLPWYSKRCDQIARALSSKL